MTASGKIDPAISKKLAQEIRAIAKRVQNEEEILIFANHKLLKTWLK
jgi:hypothetical protein